MARKGPHDVITERRAVGVLLSNRPARVWIDKADYDRIVKAHGSRTWAWVEAARYVKLKVDQKASVPVARLVVGDGGYFIRYADGDRLNLRRANLSTEAAARPGAGVKREVTEQGPSRPSSLKARPPKRPIPVCRTATSPTPPANFLKAQERRVEARAPSSSVKVLLPKRSPQVVSTVKRRRSSPL